MNVEARKTLENWRRRPETDAILTDIDGTLAPTVPTSDLSEVPEEPRLLPGRLVESYLMVAGISGQATPDAKKLVGLEEVVYYGKTTGSRYCATAPRSCPRPSLAREGRRAGGAVEGEARTRGGLRRG